MVNMDKTTSFIVTITLGGLITNMLGTFSITDVLDAWMETVWPGEDFVAEVRRWCDGQRWEGG